MFGNRTGLVRAQHGLQVQHGRVVRLVLNVRLASAEWAFPEDVERFPYQAGSIFLGAFPYEDAWTKLRELVKSFGKLREHLDGQPLNPVQRAMRIAELEALWLRALAADCMPIGTADDRHLITIAGARSGKG